MLRSLNRWFLSNLGYDLEKLDDPSTKRAELRRVARERIRKDLAFMAVATVIVIIVACVVGMFL